MSGLFRRARALRTRMELLGELQNDDFVLEIPNEEKESVLSGIDSMLKDDKIRMDEGALRFIPKKHSFVLPLMLNLGAVLVLSLGALFMWRIFGRSETALVNPDVTLESAEGRILDRLREDAQAELGAKDREIAEFQAMMADLESQKNLLETETESIIAQREEALRKEFDASLAVERARLSESGVSGNDLALALAAYETEVRSGFEAELSEARRAAEADQQQRIAELDAQRSLYEGQIASADDERARLLDELAARNNEISAMEEVQSAQESEATRQLNALRATQEKERNVTDQILALYGSVGKARLEGESELAISTLDSLELYLQQDGIRSLDVVVNRRETDVFLITAIRQLIDLETGSGDVEPAEPIVVVDQRSTELLAALAAGAAAGTQLAESGNLNAAQDIWRNAFSAMPELQEAFEAAIVESEKSGAGAAGALAGAAAAVTAEELAAARSEGQAEGFSQGISQGRTAARSEFDAELETARSESFQDGRTAGLDESASLVESLRTRLASLNARIGGLADRYAAALTRNDEEKADSRERLLGLLDAKLRIKSELDVSLHEELDEYTDATGDLREFEGRDAVYAEVLGFLAELGTADPE